MKNKLEWLSDEDRNNLCVAKWPGGKCITYQDLIDCVMAHMKFRDLIRPDRVILATVQAFDLLGSPNTGLSLDEFELGDGLNWKFPII